MTGAISIPGPETVILFGVHVKVLSALFGIGGVLLGHLMAPTPAHPLGWRRHAAVVIAGVLVAIGITIATGQAPLVVLGWSIGIGFAGIAIFQTLGASSEQAARTLGDAALEEISARLSRRKDRP